VLLHYAAFLVAPSSSDFGERNSFFAGVFFLLAFLVGALCLMAFNVKDPLLITIVLVLAAVGLVFPFNIMWSLALESELLTQRPGFPPLP
jgi:hypothetical protein